MFRAVECVLVVALLIGKWIRYRIGLIVAAILPVVLLATVREADKQSNPSPPPPATAVAAANAKAAEGPIDCKNRKQLFIDEWLFESSKNITLRMNPPAKMGPVLFSDRPWESREIGCVSVVEDSGQYKMWYCDTELDAVHRDEQRWHRVGET